MSDKTITLPLDVVRAWRDVLPPTLAQLPRTVALVGAIDAVLWRPPKTVVQWIECSEHPHPIGTRVLVQWVEDDVTTLTPRMREPRIVRWAWLDGITGV